MAVNKTNKITARGAYKWSLFGFMGSHLSVSEPQAELRDSASNSRIMANPNFLWDQ